MIVKRQGQLQLGGQFTGESNYVENYYKKGVPIKQEKVTFPNNQIMPKGQFEGGSTYNGNYQGAA